LEVSGSRESVAGSSVAGSTVGTNVAVGSGSGVAVAGTAVLNRRLLTDWLVQADALDAWTLTLADVPGAVVTAVDAV
jgi:hypothetical protein